MMNANPAEILIQERPQTSIYRNCREQIVINQAFPSDEDDSPNFVVFDAGDIPKLIEALQSQVQP